MATTDGAIARGSGAGGKFERLVAILARLRAPGGCPWDREQTFDTIKPYLLEETYEVMDAIDARDWGALADELGDLLLQAVFFAQMAAEAKHFTIEDSLNAIADKLVRRHPHVFADGAAITAEAQSARSAPFCAITAEDVSRRWDEIKAEERRERGEAKKRLLDQVPRALPALVEAQKLTSKAAQVGFDWENSGQVIEKLKEEMEELDQAREAGLRDRMEDELGDVLFVVVNLARFLNVDPEQALRRTNAKFRRRFGHIEARLEAQGKPLAEAGTAEMEALWQEAKRSV
ncbi:MAG: nucleoside triphosphate pyrophosphohydrolase [Bryobacteraceae bacterium]